MITRKQLEDEFFKLEEPLTRLQKKRKRIVAMMLRTCICRNCGKQYDNAKSRADLRGYCSQKCMKNKAFRAKGYDEIYKTLKRRGEIGDVPEYP